MKMYMMFLVVGALISSVGSANKTIENQLGGTEADRRQTYINEKNEILKAWEIRIDKLEGKAQVGAPPASPEIGVQDGNQPKPSRLTESVSMLKADLSDAQKNLNSLAEVKTDSDWGSRSAKLEGKLRSMDTTYSHAMAE